MVAVCVLRALAALAPDSHADRLGTAEYLRGWTLTDAYGDQVGYFAHFRYPGRPEHIVSAIVDENLGGIVKDATMGIPTTDPRALAAHDPEAIVADVEVGELASRVTEAIRVGDTFIDNDWTPGFKEFRAVLLTRMRTLPTSELPEFEPPGDDEREALIEAFLATPDAPAADDTTRGILDACLTARCDYGDGDPLRWSPIVVEMFLLDFLPRKATLDTGQIRAVPDFGPGKALVNAMVADGVDFTDPKATEAWIEHHNAGHS